VTAVRCAADDIGGVTRPQPLAPRPGEHLERAVATGDEEPATDHERRLTDLVEQTERGMHGAVGWSQDRKRIGTLSDQEETAGGGHARRELRSLFEPDLPAAAE